MPYISCEDAWCDYPESCQSDHWVPGPDKTCVHCKVGIYGDMKEHLSSCPEKPAPLVATKPKFDFKCAHYWLCRKGGYCRNCGKTFLPNFQSL